MRARAALLLAAIGIGLFASGALALQPAAAASGPYPVGTAITGYLQELLAPASSPPGVNVSGCRPSGAHPYPVVLLPGTLYDLAESYQALGPVLANSGYCVFGLNYGADQLTTESSGRVWAVGDIEQSAQQLSDFVRQVLSETRATKVDIVGWSQGGMMPRWYMRFDGGASYVHKLVGLAPSNHGTTVDGLFSLINADTALGLPGPLSVIGCTACDQQEIGSSFLQTLNAGRDTLPGVNYAVIETQDDEVVTPYSSAFLSGPAVENITLQSQCPSDIVDHLGLPYDSAVIQDVVNVLGPDTPGFRPSCGLGLPVLGL
jgi:triacylglycerol esterase/lipase EstA (alpha/beta hydrolase family)